MHTLFTCIDLQYMHKFNEVLFMLLVFCVHIRSCICYKDAENAFVPEGVVYERSV